ncbi:MAG: ribonuclease R [Gemmatimonadota bacterium]|jgi:ribonuclease R
MSQIDAKQLEGRVKSALRHSKRGPLRAKDLARSLDLPTQDYRGFKALLREMERSGSVYRVKGQRYALPEKINLKVGLLGVTRSGDGFVTTEGEGKDIFVAGALLESAMDGDQVVVRIEGRPRGRNPEGRIIKVLQRAHPTVVGTFREARRFGYVVPLDDRLSRDVLIPQGEDGGAATGDIVVARITAYGDRKLNPLGEVERVLGPISAPGVDVLSILFGYGLELEFPPQVEEAAREVVRKKEREGWKRRVDRTDLRIFTIDPSDAKDHDDALSLAAAGDGLWEVGVHIADVSHYVAKGSPLDLEALRRGTSVYLVDRVVPMLPHLLSSDICSLRPDLDRAAVSLFVTLDGKGQIRTHRFERTRIRSRHRLDYQEVQRVLSGEGTIGPETDEDLRTLAKIARAMRENRIRRGSIDFDLPEARVILGPGGVPTDIQKTVQLESHRLIEDFMLLANELVARECEKRGLPIPFRVHESPSPERAEELKRFLGSIGYTLPNRPLKPKDLQKILKVVEGRPEARLVSTVILRSMARARYQAENVGHFGLGAGTYTHFTSPIRRYPDLVVHRVVVRALIEGESIPHDWGGDALARLSERSSLREALAADAERDSVALKKAEFMEGHLGEEFTGTVSGVTTFGIFVLLDDYFVEGLIHVNSLTDDYYILREEEYALVGERRGRRFRLGDPLRVQVARVDRLERKIDFVLASNPGSNGV